MRITYLFILLSILLFACGDDSNETSENQATADSLKQAEEAQATEKLYAWVDKLRIRKEPKLDADIVAEVAEQTELEYLNDRTPFTTKITLRGKEYDTPWLKVRTPDNKVGWVYGGGVKAVNLSKDNPTAGNIDWDEFCRSLSEDEVCNEAIELLQLKREADRVRREGKTLYLKLDNGKEKGFTNYVSDDPDVTAVYRYREYVKSWNLYVVERMLYEGGDFMLVDAGTGTQYLTYGPPILSPSKDQFVCFSLDMMAGFMANGIEIWEKERGKPKLSFTFDVMEWGPKSPKWKGEDTVEVTTFVPASVYYDTEKNEPVTEEEEIGTVYFVYQEGNWGLMSEEE